MRLFATFTVSLLLVALNANAVPQASSPARPPILPPEPEPMCSCPGPIMCCGSIVKSSSNRGQKVLGELGIEIKGMEVPVGAGCFPHIPCKPYQPCPAVVCDNPSCCFESSKPWIGAVGCVPIPEISPVY